MTSTKISKNRSRECGAKAENRVGGRDIEVRPAVRTGDTPGKPPAGIDQTPAAHPRHHTRTFYSCSPRESGRKGGVPSARLIVDENHAVVGNRRAWHLALEHLNGSRPSRETPLQRIGLGATSQNPVEDVARGLLKKQHPGRPRPAGNAKSSTPATSAQWICRLNCPARPSKPSCPPKSGPRFTSISPN